MTDQKEEQYHIVTEVDPDDDNLDPPFVIVVQGSKQSGKTTLIKSLV